jgi:hypothetical protein
MTQNMVDYSLSGIVGAMTNPVFLPEDLEQPLLDIIREEVFKPFIKKERFELDEFYYSKYQYLVLLPEGLIRFMMCREKISQPEAEAVNIITICSSHLSFLSI